MSHSMWEVTPGNASKGLCTRCRKELICPKSFHFHAIFTLITKNNNLASTKHAALSVLHIFPDIYKMSSA